MEKAKAKLHSIIFGTDTYSGKTFDVFLLILIIISVIVIMLESITSIKVQYGNVLYIVEWVITIIFTIEYIIRIISS